MMPQETPPQSRRLWVFNKKYILGAILHLLVEVFIALRVHDRWIRPNGGDVLVIPLLYCLMRSFLNVPVFATAVGVLAFSFLVEILQYFRFVDRIGLGSNRFARVVMGSSFEGLDLLSYALGAALILLGERVASRRR